MTKGDSLVSDAMRACKVCGWTNTLRDVASEQMNNRLEPFEYTTCQAIGSTCLADPMPKLQDCYGPNYYLGGNLIPNAKFRAINWVLGLLVRWRLLTASLSSRWPQSATYAFLVKYSVPRNARILDVGSGAGRFVYRLVDMGFRNASGIDPFVTEKRIHNNGSRVTKAAFESETKRYDVIFFNHSLEHTTNPKAMLREARDHLSAGGLPVVRIPLAASLAKDLFGQHWVQWDPPRHVTLFSENGFIGAAKKAGLEVLEVTLDSADFQFTGSVGNVFRGRLDAAELHGLLKRARQVFAGWARTMNRKRIGDHAMFVMRRRSFLVGSRRVTKRTIMPHFPPPRATPRQVMHVQANKSAW